MSEDLLGNAVIEAGGASICEKQGLPVGTLALVVARTDESPDIPAGSLVRVVIDDEDAIPMVDVLIPLGPVKGASRDDMERILADMVGGCCHVSLATAHGTYLWEALANLQPLEDQDE